MASKHLDIETSECLMIEPLDRKTPTLEQKVQMIRSRALNELDSFCGTGVN